MSIIRAIHNENFIVMNKVCLQDKKLSWKAKGIYSYLMSLPSNWNIKTSEVKNHSADGRTSLLSGIKELIKNGYCEQIASRNKHGAIESYDYVIKETPDSTIPQVDSLQSGFPLAVNRPLLNNNSNKIECIKKISIKKKPVKKEKTKKKFNPNTLGGKLAQFLLDKIEESDPSFITPDLGKWEGYFNKMIYVDGFIYADMISIITFAHSKDFWKSIVISPYKLKANYSTLKIQKNNSYIYKNKNKDKNKDVFEQAKEEGFNQFNSRHD